MSNSAAAAENPDAFIESRSDGWLAVSAGSLAFLFDPAALAARRICRGDTEVIRAIYGAVRDRNWVTVPPAVREFRATAAGGRFTIQFKAACQRDEVDFEWEGSLSGTENGLRFEFNGSARSEFLRARIGLCVLHPPSCAGQECEVEHWDGTRQTGLFPREIAPTQAFLNIRSLRHAAGPDAVLELLFDGEVFEMEDQRNWSDASFKTYGTPLDRPFPALVRPGDRVHQTVTARLISHRAFPSRRSARSQTSSRLLIEFRCPVTKPAIGFGAGRPPELPERAVRLLRAAAPDHLRFDCRGSDPDWAARLSRAGGQAAALGAGLHIAVFLGAEPEAELRALAACAARLPAPVQRWLVFDAGRPVTSLASIRLAVAMLADAAPGAGFAAGTASDFAELNLDRPPAGADWIPCFSLNPQVHAGDELTLIENLEGQRDVARAAAGLAGRPAVVSPVTLLPRSSTAPDGSPASPRHDRRQSSLFAAGWTLGSLSALGEAGHIRSVTYYECFGPGGILSADGVYPVYHVFRGAAELAQFAPARRGTPRDCEFSALAGLTGAGQRIVWLANHQQDSLEIDLEPDGAFGGLAIRSLEADDLARVTRDPESWWNAPASRAPGRTVRLGPRALAKVEFLP